MSHDSQGSGVELVFLNRTIGASPEEDLLLQMQGMIAEQLAENRKRARQNRDGPRYLLQGLLECGGCGYAYYGKGATRLQRNPEAPYAYYRCGGMDGYRFGGTPVCSNRPVRLDRFDAAVWDDVCAVLQNPHDLRQEFERRLKGEGAQDVNLTQTRRQMAAAGYAKAEPTFSDAVAHVRRLFWLETVLKRPHHHEAFKKLPPEVRNLLLDSLTLAA